MNKSDLGSYRKVTLTIEIPEDKFVSRIEDTLVVTVPWCVEGMRPEGVAHLIDVAIDTVAATARFELQKKGLLPNGG